MIKTTTITHEMESLYEELVPSMGKAETEAGEILRAYARIRYRYLNDGDMIGVDYGNETCNAAARYLAKHIGGRVAQEINLIWGSDYTDAYERFLRATEEFIYGYLQDNPDAFTNTTEDFWDYFTAEDRDWEDEYEDDDWCW